jgi:hypothetical protein
MTLQIVGSSTMRAEFEAIHRHTVSNAVDCRRCPIAEDADGSGDDSQQTLLLFEADIFGLG